MKRLVFSSSAYINIEDCLSMFICFMLSLYYSFSTTKTALLQVDLVSFKVRIADSLSLNFWIFPLAVLGNESDGEKRKTYFGTTKA